MQRVWSILFGVFPVWFGIFCLAALAVLVIVLVARIIAGVLDTLPFV